MHSHASSTPPRLGCWRGHQVGAMQFWFGPGGSPGHVLQARFSMSLERGRRHTTLLQPGQSPLALGLSTGDISGAGSLRVSRAILLTLPRFSSSARSVATAHRAPPGAVTAQTLLEAETAHSSGHWSACLLGAPSTPAPPRAPDSFSLSLSQSSVPASHSGSAPPWTQKPSVMWASQWPVGV